MDHSNEWVQALRQIYATVRQMIQQGIDNALANLVKGGKILASAIPVDGTTVSVNGSGQLTATGSGGTVTSIGVTVPASILSVSPATIAGSGTFAFTLATQSANTVWAGPTSGGAATPTFRALVAADIPSLPASIITSGTITAARLPVATTSSLGVVQPDGTSIGIAAGVISVIGGAGADATPSATGLVEIDQSPIAGHPVAVTTPRIGQANGVAALDAAALVPVAQLPVLGVGAPGVGQPDGSTIVASTGGTLSGGYVGGAGIAVSGNTISATAAGLTLTSKGDLQGYATGPVRVPVSGTNGRVLTEDSTAAAGVSWQPAAGALALLSDVFLNNLQQGDTLSFEFALGCTGMWVNSSAGFGATVVEDGTGNGVLEDGTGNTVISDPLPTVLIDDTSGWLILDDVAGCSILSA